MGSSRLCTASLAAVPHCDQAVMMLCFLSCCVNICFRSRTRQYSDGSAAQARGVLQNAIQRVFVRRGEKLPIPTLAGDLEPALRHWLVGIVRVALCAPSRVGFDGREAALGGGTGVSYCISCMGIL